MASSTLSPQCFFLSPQPTIQENLINPYSSTLTKKLLSQKFIKPSSPTPPTKKWHKLSLIDQALTNIYIPFALFYTKQQLDSISKTPYQISQILEDSLSQILTSYYPYAGRLHDNTIVDCDDTGAEFLQVQIDGPISKALDWHNAFIEDAIFPENLPWANCTDRGLVVAQLSYFNCGGIAISMCISHKIGDGCNGYYLFHDWAEITSNPNGAKPSLCYLEQSIYPSPPSGPFASPVIESNKEDCVQRRYIFSPSKLRELKTLVAAEAEIQNPTRTEVVSALLFKSIVSAVKANSGSFLPSTLVQYIDLRHQFNLAPNVVGNLLTIFPTSIYKEENMKLSTIVGEMRKGKDQAYKRDNLKENVWVEEILESASAKEEMYHNSGCDTFLFSSLVKFPLHEIDFGWGKPIKVSLANGPFGKIIYLMGNQDGGLDVFVMLSQQDMSVLERDTQLLEFAYLVPSS
ncbi:hypothetical protein HAX54_001083 [Datura stramonium]|uniref:Uncharacterized protein n=1 Tax=Datura stramonium TaxID=4076 RepID=A0ABS8RS84_DATST|nr:hypothetical protein [Datura stramonium]